MTEGQINRLIELLEHIAASLSELDETIWNFKEDFRDQNRKQNPDEEES